MVREGASSSTVPRTRWPILECHRSSVRVRRAARWSGFPRRDGRNWPYGRPAADSRHRAEPRPGPRGSFNGVGPGTALRRAARPAQSLDASAGRQDSAGTTVGEGARGPRPAAQPVGSGPSAAHGIGSDPSATRSLSVCAVLLRLAGGPGRVTRAAATTRIPTETEAET